MGCQQEHPHQSCQKAGGRSVPMLCCTVLSMEWLIQSPRKEQIVGFLFNINAMSGSWKSLLCGDNDESQHLEQSPEHSRAGLSSQVLSLLRKEDLISGSCPNACLTPEIGLIP